MNKICKKFLTALVISLIIQSFDKIYCAQQDKQHYIPYKDPEYVRNFFMPLHYWHPAYPMGPNGRFTQNDLEFREGETAKEVTRSAMNREWLRNAMNEGRVQEVQNFLSRSKYYLLEGDSNNFSPLMQAVYLENVDLIKAILPFYGDHVAIHISGWRSKDGKTTLDIAKNIKNPEKRVIILELLGYKEMPTPSSAHSSESKTAKEERTSKINVKAKPFTPQIKKSPEPTEVEAKELNEAMTRSKQQEREERLRVFNAAKDRATQEKSQRQEEERLRSQRARRAIAAAAAQPKEKWADVPVESEN